MPINQVSNGAVNSLVNRFNMLSMDVKLPQNKDDSLVLKNVDKMGNFSGVEFKRQVSDCPKGQISFKDSIKVNADDISKPPENFIGKISSKELQAEKSPIKYYALEDFFNSPASFSNEDIAAIAKTFVEEHHSRLEEEVDDVIYNFDVEFPCEEYEINEHYYFKKDLVSEAKEFVVQNDIIPKAVERSLLSAAEKWNKDGYIKDLDGEPIAQKQIDLIIATFNYEIGDDVSGLAYKLAAGYN
jgi:hypothetical protein